MKNKNFEILDCTLRDGGYYNNWDFDKDLTTKYINAMQELPVDIIEIGYRSEPQEEYLGKHFYLPDFVLEEIARLDFKKKVAIMLNEKSTRPKHLDKLLKGLQPVISLIRLAVDPKNFDRAVILAKEIKKRGFDVAFNMMYMSKYYNDNEFLMKLNKVNGLARYLNIVDSYGGMLPQQIEELVSIVKSKCDVKIGFHGHNNLELAFANTLAAINAGCEIIDATITGMGRGAGNLKTELILTHLSSGGIIDFDFNVLSNIIEDWMPIQKEYEWGTNLPYMVSGANSLPQKDVMTWFSLRFYSINSIIRALHYQKSGDTENIHLPVFKPQQQFKNVIIIGGGPCAVTHAEAIKKFISKFEQICIIHASSKNAKSYEDVNCRQYYCLVGNEGHRLEKVFNDLTHFHGKCILPPSPREMGTYIPEIIKNNSLELTEVKFTDKFTDSHTALALQTAILLDAETVYVAGYEGYSNELITSKEQGLIQENEYMFSLAKKVVNIVSLFPTQYSLITKSVYSLID